MVRIITHNGHYHMYKVVGAQHWVGMVDHRIGNLTNQVTAEEAAQFEDTETDCYSADVIASFGRATIDQLKKFENV